MGLNKSTGRKTFVNIKEGKLIVKRSKDAIPEEFSSLTGVLVGVYVAPKKWNDIEYEELALTIVDNDETYNLQMKLDSGYGRGFCYQILNADLAKPITFSPKYSEVDGKKESWLFLNQFGAGLKRAFTKDNPNGLPPMEKTSFKGKVMWDNTNQLDFWRKMIERQIKPNLLHPVVAENDFDKVKQDIPDADSITEPIDDLPF